MICCITNKMWKILNSFVQHTLIYVLTTIQNKEPKKTKFQSLV